MNLSQNGLLCINGFRTRLVQARPNLRQNVFLYWLAQFDFFTSQAKEAFWPVFVGAWKPQAFGERKFGQLQLLAADGVPTPRPS